MISKKIALAIHVCVLLLGLQLASHATTTVQCAECSGDISENGTTCMAVYVLVEKSTTIGGEICMAGKTGNLAFTANAMPLSATFSSSVVNGVTSDYAAITTKPFACLNLLTGQYVEAYMTVDLTKTSAGQNLIGFQVYSEANGALLYQTVTPGTTNPAEIPLVFGSEMFEL